MSHFQQCVQDLIRYNEGGYADLKGDSGGATKYGITIAVARANGYMGDMKDMPIEVAYKVYATPAYWDSRFEELPYQVAFNIFDGAVNSGMSQSIKWLQRAVGAVDDGKLGPATLAKVKGASSDWLIGRYNAERLSTLCSLKSFETFGKGWGNRIANNIKRGLNNV